MNDALFSFDLPADVYRLQRRPNHAHVVINDDYIGLRVLDPWTGADVARVPFGAAYAGGASIANWALRADGAAAIVFDDEGGRACFAPLNGEPVRGVEHPPWRTTVGMPYDWRGDTLWLKDPDSFRFATVDADLAMTERDGTDALSMNRAWRRAVDRMRRAQARCLRVDPECAQMLTVVRADDSPTPRIGRVSWVGKPEFTVPVPDRLIQLASADKQTIALYEYEAVFLDPEGTVARRIAAPAGFHNVDLDTLPPSPGHPPALILASAAIDGRLLTRFHVHALP